MNTKKYFGNYLNMKNIVGPTVIVHVCRFWNVISYSNTCRDAKSQFEILSEKISVNQFLVM